MTADSVNFEMPPLMKVEDCEAFFTFLQNAAGKAVSLQCGEVTRITGLAAQMILFAAHKWAAENAPFQMVNLSAGCIESLDILGMTEILSQEGVIA